MSIVVFWLDAGAAAHMEFSEAQLVDALAFAERKRKEGRRHVTLSTELPGAVGKAGVQCVEDGRLPAGDAYEWTKAHRGAGPNRGT